MRWTGSRRQTIFFKIFLFAKIFFFYRQTWEIGPSFETPVIRRTGSCRYYSNARKSFCVYSLMHYPKSHHWVMFLISTRKRLYFLITYGIIFTLSLCVQLDQLISTNYKSSSFSLNLSDLNGNFRLFSGESVYERVWSLIDYGSHLWNQTFNCDRVFGNWKS